MKKNILRTTAIAFLAFASILFTSCFDPIYHTIRTDVKPEKPTVSGYVSSIARYKVGNKEYLVTAADNGLRYKPSGDQNHGSWKVYKGLPFEIVHSERNQNTLQGKYIAKVVSDSTYLYLLTVDFNSDNTPINPELYALKVTDWNSTEKTINPCNKVTLPRDLKILFLKEGESNFSRGGFNIFSTNDYENGKRHAYIRIGDDRAQFPADAEEKETAYKTPTVFKLDGFNTPSLVSNSEAKSLAPIEIDPNNKGGINSVIMFDGSPRFFNSPVSSYCTINNKQNVYLANGKDLYHSQGINSLNFKKAISLKFDIASFALTDDSILIGCANDKTGSAGGIHKVSFINDGQPRDSESEFDNNNAKIQLPTSYMVPVLLNASPLDGKHPEGKAIVYGAASFAGLGANYNNRIENIGLWSYYPTRGNWNRE